MSAALSRESKSPLRPKRTRRRAFVLRGDSVREFLLSFPAPLPALHGLGLPGRWSALLPVIAPPQHTQEGSCVVPGLMEIRVRDNGAGFAHLTSTLFIGGLPMDTTRTGQSSSTNYSPEHLSSSQGEA